MDSAEVPPTIDKESFAEFVVSFSETALILFSAGSVIDTLASVIDLAVATIEGCDFAGLFLVDDDVVTTPVHTDPIVVEVDALQQRTGEGPCLDAIAQRATTWRPSGAGFTLHRRRPGWGYAVCWPFL